MSSHPIPSHPISSHLLSSPLIQSSIAAPSLSLVTSRLLLSADFHPSASSSNLGHPRSWLPTAVLVASLPVSMPTSLTVSPPLISPWPALLLVRRATLTRRRRLRLSLWLRVRKTLAETPVPSANKSPFSSLCGWFSRRRLFIPDPLACHDPRIQRGSFFFQLVSDEEPKIVWSRESRLWPLS